MPDLLPKGRAELFYVSLKPVFVAESSVIITIEPLSIDTSF